MPDLGAALITAMLKGGIAQYPDKRVYNAATRLLPDERPQFQVKAVDPDPQMYPIFRIKPHAEGITNAGKYRQILINKQSPAYKNDDLLSAVLAHEAVHANHADTPEQYDEAPAYQKQYEVLNRLGYKNPAYTKAIWAKIRSLQDKERQ